MADHLRGYATERPEETKGYILQQTMIRIKNKEKSLDFYSRVLGMRVLRFMDYPQWNFSLYFMGYVNEADIPKDDKEAVKWLFQQPATLELTYNYGTDTDPNFPGYHNGNTEPRGYGHIGIDVPDVEKACERFEKLGVKFHKRLADGNMKHIAFICDPDDYRIEIFSHNTMA